jgi:hypothetical protein
MAVEEDEPVKRALRCGFLRWGTAKIGVDGRRAVALLARSKLEVEPEANRVSQLRGHQGQGGEAMEALESSRTEVGSVGLTAIAQNTEQRTGAQEQKYDASV